MIEGLRDFLRLLGMDQPIIIEEPDEDDEEEEDTYIPPYCKHTTK